MNVRLLIVFGLVIQLFAGHVGASCDRGPVGPPAGDDPAGCCGGCCQHTERAPAPEPAPCDTPCDACPVCPFLGMKPNERATAPAPEAGVRIDAPRVHAWSERFDDLMHIAERQPAFVDHPPPRPVPPAPPRTGRWLM